MNTISQFLLLEQKYYFEQITSVLTCITYKHSHFELFMYTDILCTV